MKKLNLTDTVLLALMVALLVIGGHQTIVIGRVEGFSQGFIKSYWIFMFMIILMVIYQARKNKVAKEGKQDSAGPLKGKIRQKAPNKARKR
jgi:hypothetical protein